MEFINQNKQIGETKKNINFEDENFKIFDIDFADVKGQENAKRALEIAAAGWHNCFLQEVQVEVKQCLLKDYQLFYQI